MSTQWKCYTKPFRDTWIRVLRSDVNLQISDGTVPGLFLRYSATTRCIKFYLGYKIRQIHIQRNILIGRYGDFSIKEVKDRAWELRKMIATGIDPMQVEKDKEKQHIKALGQPISVLFTEYMEKYAKIYKKPRTQDANWAQYRLYLAPIFADMRIRQIEEKHVMDAYTKWVKKTSFATANKAISLLSNFWDWCESCRYVPRDSNPCKYVRKGTNKTYKPQILDQDGYRALSHALDVGPRITDMHPRLFNALRVLMLTGCRASEITGLEVDEVVLLHKVIHLKDSKTGARDVKLSDAVIPYLETALAEAAELGSQYVFPGIGNIARPINNIRKPFEWALKYANLPHMRIHDLRHSFISMGANIGENMAAMKEAAGHSRITTTEGYTHIMDSSTYRAINNVANAICG